MKYICFSFVLFFIIPLHIQAQQWSEYFVVPEMFGCISDSREAAEQNARGLQKVIDYAISKIEAVNEFLRQRTDEKFMFDEEVQLLEQLFEG